MSTDNTYAILKAKYQNPGTPKYLEVTEAQPISNDYKEMLALYEKILKLTEKPTDKLEGTALIEHVLRLNRESQTKRKLSNA